MKNVRYILLTHPTKLNVEYIANIFLFKITMLKHLKEYLDMRTNNESTSILSLNKIPSNILIGCVGTLLILVLWLSSQLFFNFAGNTTIDPISLIVHQVRDVSELATAIFETDAIVDATRKDGPLKAVESKILYIAHGVVRVGIDLNEFRDDNVQVEDNKIIVTLPPFKLLDLSTGQKVAKIDRKGFYRR